MCTSRLSVSIIAKRIIRGIAFITLGGALILAFMIKSINRDLIVLEGAAPDQGQDHSTEER